MQPYIWGVHECTQKPDLHVRTMHSHDCYELFYLIAGDADYRVEGSRYHLLPGDIILMRKGEVHMFQLRTSARYERMHINFDISQVLVQTGTTGLMSIFHDRPLGKFNHYPAEYFPGNHWKSYLEKICHTEDPAKQLCYLLPLLSDLAECFDTIKATPELPEKDRTVLIIRYINANLTREISLDRLAEQFYISKTHMCRVFKQSTGTTVWKYITLKRLFLAKSLIEAGAQPSEVYTRCGFKDYTTFFRSYKQHFGVSPKSHIASAP